MCLLNSQHMKCTSKLIFSSGSISCFTRSNIFPKEKHACERYLVRNANFSINLGRGETILCSFWIIDGNPLTGCTANDISRNRLKNTWLSLSLCSSSTPFCLCLSSPNLPFLLSLSLSLRLSVPPSRSSFSPLFGCLLVFLSAPLRQGQTAALLWWSGHLTDCKSGLPHLWPSKSIYECVCVCARVCVCVSLYLHGWCVWAFCPAYCKAGMNSSNPLPLVTPKSIKDPNTHTYRHTLR